MPDGGRVLVVGSLNLDVVLRVPALPAPGQTLSARSVTRSPGGKGLNQAVAAERAGGAVRLAGGVGGDADGDALLEALGAAGVETALVRRHTPTGSATILVDDAGENEIVLVAGANHAHGESDADALLGDAAAGDIVLLQGEIPAAVNRAVSTTARQRGARVLWNAAPAPRDPADVVPADLIVVNEGELADLAALLGRPASARAVGRALAATVIVTLGEAGAVAWAPAGEVRAAAPRVEVVDTTGAGDVFVGALAVALQRDEPLETALTRACAAGALAVMRAGAWGSAPTRLEVDRLLRA